MNLRCPSGLGMLNHGSAGDDRLDRPALSPLDERNHLALRPAPVIAIGTSQKGAVSTVFCFHEGDAGIVEQLFASGRQYANEWVVFRVKDERRHRDALQDVGGSRAGVVV